MLTLQQTPALVHSSWKYFRGYSRCSTRAIARETRDNEVSQTYSLTFGEYLMSTSNTGNENARTKPPTHATQGACPKKLSAPLLILAAFIGIGIGVAIGYFAFHPAQNKNLDSIDPQTVIATYEANGTEINVTPAEVLQSQFGSNQSNIQGTPSADMVLDYVRNQILLNEAEKRGLSVADQEIDDYATTYLGTSDCAQIGERYGITEDQAKLVIKQNALLQKLYEEIVSVDSSVEVPTPPEAPSDGDYTSAKQEYADYIVELVGDEWSTSSNGWARTDGPYYEAMSGQDFDQQGATYDQAMLAYSVAYQQYTEGSASGNEAWYTFINKLYKGTSIEIFGLYV